MATDKARFVLYQLFGNHFGSGSFCATLKDQVKPVISHKKSDMANSLDPMNLKQIITLHVDGLSNRKIGELLDISLNTVNDYMRLFSASDYNFDELLELDNPKGCSLHIPQKISIDLNS
jgi:transposase-like protein